MARSAIGGRRACAAVACRRLRCRTPYPPRKRRRRKRILRLARWRMFGGRLRPGAPCLTRFHDSARAFARLNAERGRSERPWPTKTSHVALVNILVGILAAAREVLDNRRALIG